MEIRDWVVGLMILELVQLAAVWAYLRQRYWVPLRHLDRLTRQMAENGAPKSYYIAGPCQIEGVTRHLEAVGTRLADLQRQRQQDDFNLNMLLANMVEGVMVVDERHVVRLVNDELRRLFELRHSPLNQTLLEALREARVELIVRETIAGGEPRRHEVTLEGASDGPRHLEISAVPIRNRPGEIGGAVLVFHDITRIKRLEMVRSEFVANVSHELRTPLAIFRGYLELLRERPDLCEEDRQKMLGALERNSQRLHALVEDLLALTRLESRQEPLEFSVLRLEPFFHQLADDWNRRATTLKAELELQLAPGLPPLEVNPLRFEQVILNLLENAVAYSSPPRRLVIAAREQGEGIELRIADNGMGIPPGDLPHIFQRFYRVDKSRGRNSGGTGLGLSIVRTIVESHQGTVRAESELGQGTTIVVWLPLRQKPDETAPAVEEDLFASQEIAV